MGAMPLDAAVQAVAGERVRLERVEDEVERGVLLLDVLRRKRAISAHDAHRGALNPMIEAAVGREDPREIARLRAELTEVRAERDQLRDALEKVTEVARRDGLTGVLNRAAFDSILDREWNRSQRAKTPLALLFVDVDNFKNVNDTLGHPAGDVALKAIAHVIEGEAKRSGDVVARYGGDEFVVILPGTSLETALAVGERVRSAVAELQLRVRDEKDEEKNIALSVSVGGASLTAGFGTEPSPLVALADRATMKAKVEGRNVCVGAAIENGQDAFYRPKRTQPPANALVTNLSTARRGR